MQEDNHDASEKLLKEKWRKFHDQLEVLELNYDVPEHAIQTVYGVVCKLMDAVSERAAEQAVDTLAKGVKQ